MKVICEKIVNADTGESSQKDSWLTVGKTYYILSVSMNEGGETEYRIIADDGMTPVLFKANQFRLINADLPENWVANCEPDSYFELAPEAWTKPGFWERYFDSEMEAVSCFQLEKKKIIGQQ